MTTDVSAERRQSTTRARGGGTFSFSLRDTSKGVTSNFGRVLETAGKLHPLFVLTVTSDKAVCTLAVSNKSRRTVRISTPPRSIPWENRLITRINTWGNQEPLNLGIKGETCYVFSAHEIMSLIITYDLRN